MARRRCPPSLSIALSLVSGASSDTGDSAHFLQFHVVAIHRTSRQKARVRYLEPGGGQSFRGFCVTNLLPLGAFFFLSFCLRRVMKPRNFVALSPSRQQVAGQTAMESIPLVFEPRSRFYTSPVVVLDFQVRDYWRHTGSACENSSRK